MDVGAWIMDGVRARRHRALLLGVQWAAFVCALIACVTVLFMPLGEEETADAQGHLSVATQTLWGSDNPQAVGIIVAATAITLIPLLARGRARRPVAATVAVLLALFVMAGMLSVGLFFVPAAVLQVVAALIPTEVEGARPEPVGLGVGASRPDGSPDPGAGT